jgi:hypothetical protein
MQQISFIVLEFMFPADGIRFVAAVTIERYIYTASVHVL